VVEGFKLNSILVNTPVPVPSVVLVAKAIVGLGIVLQTTPLAVTVLPPSVITVPPHEAVLVAIELGKVVVSVSTSLLIGESVSLFVQDCIRTKLRIIVTKSFGIGFIIYCY
jgi:hypothetical protein